MIGKRKHEREGVDVKQAPVEEDECLRLRTTV